MISKLPDFHSFLKFNILAKSNYLWLPWWLSGKESACQFRKCGLTLGQEDPVEKEMATHSSILAWEVPWTEEPRGLESMGSQKNQTQLSN